MTTLIILLLGGGAVLIISAIESNPDGSDVSVLQTIRDIWNDQLSFKQPGATTAPNTNAQSLQFGQVGSMTNAQQFL